MNLTIDELERRLWIENRQPERAALLEFEEAFGNAWDFADEDGISAEAVAQAGYSSMRTQL